MNNIYIASYNRAEEVKTYDYLGCGKIVVPKSQEDQYRERYGDAVVGIPDELDGSAGAKRNAILDMIKENEPDGYGWIIDDDLVKIKRKKEGNKIVKFDNTQRGKKKRTFDLNPIIKAPIKGI